MSIDRQRSDSPLEPISDFAAFYERHSESLLIFFARRVYDPSIALDLTAETFAQALLGRKRFRGRSEGEAAAWLYGIARHQLSRYYRRGRAERRAIARLALEIPTLGEDERDRIEERAGLGDLRSSMREALAHLPDAQRQALSLRIVEELPYAEVALRLGISEQAARARVSRGLRGLADALESPPEEVSLT